MFRNVVHVRVCASQSAVACLDFVREEEPLKAKLNSRFFLPPSLSFPSELKCLSTSIVYSIICHIPASCCRPTRIGEGLWRHSGGSFFISVANPRRCRWKGMLGAIVQWQDRQYVGGFWGQNQHNPHILPMNYPHVTHVPFGPTFHQLLPCKEPTSCLWLYIFLSKMCKLLAKCGEVVDARWLS